MRHANTSIFFRRKTEKFSQKIVHCKMCCGEFQRDTNRCSISDLSILMNELLAANIVKCGAHETHCALSLLLDTISRRHMKMGNEERGRFKWE